MIKELLMTILPPIIHEMGSGIREYLQDKRNIEREILIEDSEEEMDEDEKEDNKEGSN